jgi:hypothetical protein
MSSDGLTIEDSVITPQVKEKKKSRLIQLNTVHNRSLQQEECFQYQPNTEKEEELDLIDESKVIIFKFFRFVFFV